MSKNTIQKIMGQNLTKKLRMQKYDEELKTCFKKKVLEEFVLQSE